MRQGTSCPAPFVACLAAVVLLQFADVRDAGATLYCDRPYKQLRLNPGRPYNAVGLLNNGCTAFLIDSSHIAAAAHCFENTTTGEWQTGLRFYPNFHPARVAADEQRVPRADVLRVVVGSRAGENVLGSGMDWGIARLGNWQDTAVRGLDLTPLPLARKLPAAGKALSNPAYTRHHFPYDDSSLPSWDDMVWDTDTCGWVEPNFGAWAITRHPAPIYDGVNRDFTGCNSRWAAGMLHANCALADVVDDVVVHNCDTIGGSSGSPVMYKDGSGTWRVIGVGHGGGSAATASSNDFSLLAPSCSPDVPANSDNVAASSLRFVDAPRFAANVAVHRSPVDAGATAVFAVDTDRNSVVYRRRLGPEPTYSSEFTYWKNLGTPPVRRPRLSRIAACSTGPANRPQIFVVTNNKSIYTRSANLLGTWGPWSSFGVPAGAGSIADLDAATDADGRCLLIMTSSQGVYARAKTSDSSWGAWSTVAAGAFTSVTALNYAGTVSAALLDTAGEIWRTSLGPTGWAVPVMLGRPEGIAAWRDIDLTWDEAARGFLLAIPASWSAGVPGPGNTLYFTPLYGTLPWSEWRFFENHLWAPGAPPANPPNLQTITASRWMEDRDGATSPVVFGTDDQGNVYLVEYARVGAPGWNLNWKSFYHEYIPYP